MVRTAHNSWKTTDATDEQCRGSGCGTSSCSVELGAADTSDQLRRVCTALAEEHPAIQYSSTCSNSTCKHLLSDSVVMVIAPIRTSPMAMGNKTYRLELTK